jgi:hypothetical protein
MAAVDRRFFFRSAGSLAFVGVAGCLAPVTPKPAFESLTRPVLPQPQMSPDAVVLEVAVVRFGAASSKPVGETASDEREGGEREGGGREGGERDGGGREGGERDGGERDGGGRLVEGVFWQAVDEQSLAVDIRNELRRNGFRVGIIRGALPEALRKQLDQQRSAAREIDPENEPGSLESSVQRLQSRSGKRSKLLMGEQTASLSIFVPEGERLVGRTFQAAQCLLSVKTFARGDGGADLEITPEVEHGEARQRWLGQSHEGTYRLDANRERWQLEKLRCRLALAPGQTVVLSCIDPPIGAGANFFARDTREAGVRRVVLVRLAQTQVDELFTERPASAALTTPLE